MPPAVRPEVLRVASHLAPGVQPLYAFLAEYLADRLNRRAEFVVAETYERCGQDIDDVCFVCSIPYLLVADAGLIDMEVVAAPVLRGDRYDGQPIYYSDIIVSAESSVATFADLRGATVAYNEPYSHSGYVTLLHHLATLGEGIGFFGAMVEAGFHRDAIQMVADGRADAAAIDTQVLDIEVRDRPQLADQIRRIASIGPSTIQPVVVSRTRLTGTERRAIAVGLLEVGDDPSAREALDDALVDRFMGAEESSYDDVRQMLARVRGAGLIGPEWDERWQSMIAPPARSTTARKGT